MNAGAFGPTFGCGSRPTIEAMLARLKEMVNAATTAIKKRSGVASGTRFKNCSTGYTTGDLPKGNSVKIPYGEIYTFVCINRNGV